MTYTQFLPELEETDKRTGVTRDGKPVTLGFGSCEACGDACTRDSLTHLCKPCWRIAVLLRDMRLLRDLP